MTVSTFHNKKPLSELTQVKPELKQQGAYFWSLSAEKQKLIADAIPKLDSWTIQVRRDAIGYWAFDLEDYGVKDEGLVGGTEKVIDYHYEQLCDLFADEHSQAELTISTTSTDSYTTMLVLIDEDPAMPNSHNYFDASSEMVCWLCPFLQHMFGYAPEHLYVTVTPTA